MLTAILRARGTGSIYGHAAHIWRCHHCSLSGRNSERRIKSRIRMRILLVLMSMAVKFLSSCTLISVAVLLFLLSALFLVFVLHLEFS